MPVSNIRRPPGQSVGAFHNARLRPRNNPSIHHSRPPIRQRQSRAKTRIQKSHDDRRDRAGGRRGQHINPFHVLGATFLARYLRKYIIPDLPGADETEKLNAIVEKAPPWLIWFTHADVYLRILGLKVPDLSSVNRLVRGKLTFNQLPEGPFECRLLPDGMEDEFYTSKDKDFTNTGDTTNMTPRERRRALRWRGQI